MKKLIVILSTVLISVIAASISVTTIYINGYITVQNDTVNINTPIIIDHLSSNNDFIELNNCMNNAFPKPYLQASFVENTTPIDLIKDQWIQITGFVDMINHDLTMSGDSVIIDSISGAGDYDICICFVSGAGTTGQKDKNLKLAITVNDTIQLVGMSNFPVSKDNNESFTSFPSEALYRLSVNDVVKAWMMNRSDNSDYTIEHCKLVLTKK